MTPPDRPPWWLWPNLLAVDAPAVAVVWQRFLGDRLGAPVPIAATAALALTVWGVYLLDRRLDAGRGPADALADRHRFAGRRPRLVGGLAAGALALAAVIGTSLLPPGAAAAGAGLGLAVAGYLLVVHRTGGAPGAGTGGWKEAAVGVLFAAGVGLPVWAAGAGDGRDWLPPLAAFAAACGLNCALIARWEAAPGRGPRAGVPAAAAAGGLALVFAAGCDARVSAALAAAVGLLAVVHLARPAVGPRAARVLADAALLTPLPAAVWP